MNLPTARPITIREVGPRDGTQSLGAFIDTRQKVGLIAAARLAQDILGHELPGQVMKAGPRSLRHAA